MAAAEDTRDLTGPRWSNAVVCPRAAVYDADPGHPRDEPSDRVRASWKRGRMVDRGIKAEIRSELVAEGRRPRDEEEVPWPRLAPVGTGHADMYVPHERLIVEIVSNAGADYPERKGLQAAGYTINHPHAEQALVIAVDPMTGERADYPIVVEAFEARVAEIEQTVVEALEQRTLPDRVCSWPGDGPAMFCPHASWCFRDWEPEPLDAVIGAEAAVRELVLETDAVADLERRLKAAKARRQAVRDRLRAHVPANETVEAAGVKIRRSEFVRRSFSLSDYLNTGHRVTRAMKPFCSEGTQERWTVKQ